MDFSDERYEIVIDVYKNHRDEFQQWVRLNGMKHYNEFYEAQQKGETVGDLAIFVSERFMEWKRLKDAVMGE